MRDSANEGEMEEANYFEEESEIFRFKDRISSRTTSVFVLPSCSQYASKIASSFSGSRISNRVVIVVMYAYFSYNSIMRTAYQYRLRLTTTQQSTIDQWLEFARRQYNY